MKKLSIILSLIILISCSSKENSALDNNLLPQGLYKIIELKSDISMDLDLNGNPTKDFLV